MDCQTLHVLVHPGHMGRLEIDPDATEYGIMGLTVDPHGDECGECLSLTMVNG